MATRRNDEKHLISIFFSQSNAIYLTTATMLEGIGLDSKVVSISNEWRVIKLRLIDASACIHEAIKMQ